MSGTLVLACGALAHEITALQRQTGAAFTLQCLPAILHNTPERIVPELRRVLDARGGEFARVMVGYADCGTGGGLDRMLEDYPNATRLPGAHCYDFYGGSVFHAAMEDEPGTFFLTDYLARHFDTLVIQGMGLDRRPELMSTYFAHYSQLLYLVQDPSRGFQEKARAAAATLGLQYSERVVGYGALGAALAQLQPSRTGAPAFAS